MSVEHPSPAQLRQSMAFLSSLPSPTEISVSRDRHPVLGDRTEEKTILYQSANKVFNQCDQKLPYQYTSTKQYQTLLLYCIS